VLTIWLTFLAGITLPIWYWAPRGTDIAGYSANTTVHGLAFGYFPHGPHGPGGVGLFVDSVPTALLAAACFLVLFLIFNYVMVLTARAHARVVDTKTLGVGLAAAVLIDATVVRGILLPTAMSLLGERCWHLPRWLSWLPGRTPVGAPLAPGAGDGHAVDHQPA
jgi:hypothetical protein